MHYLGLILHNVAVMITSRLSIAIQRPLAEVYDFLMEPKNYLLWMSGVKRIEATDGMTIGSLLTFIASGLGRTIKSQAIVTANDGRSMLQAVSRQGPLTFDSRYQLVARDATTTELTLINTIETGTLFRLAESALQSISDARYGADLETLRQLLEHRHQVADTDSRSRDHGGYNYHESLNRG